jgi:ribonuclease HI
VKYIGYFDGACMPTNPGGNGGWGYHIDSVDVVTVELAQDSGVLPPGPKMTCNVAEYTATLECRRRWVALEIAAALILRAPWMRTRSTCDGSG